MISHNSAAAAIRGFLPETRGQKCISICRIDVRIQEAVSSSKLSKNETMRRHNTGRCLPWGAVLITQIIYCVCVFAHISPSRAPHGGVGASASQWGYTRVSPVSGDAGRGGWQWHRPHLRRGGATAGPAAAAPQQVNTTHYLDYSIRMIFSQLASNCEDVEADDGLIYIILVRLYFISHHIIVSEDIRKVMCGLPPFTLPNSHFTHESIWGCYFTQILLKVQD